MSFMPRNFRISNRSVGGRIGTGREILSIDAVRQAVPSAFASGAHESRSARYVFIDSGAIIESLIAEGFNPVFACERKARKDDRHGFTKHMLRFRHTRHMEQASKLNGVFPEVVMTNAHDGTGMYNLFGGLFRLACLNGMVVSEGFSREVKVPHKGDVAGRVIDGSYEVLEESVRAADVAAAWRGIELDNAERQVLAEGAFLARFADAEGDVTTAIQPNQLLTLRRSEDRSRDLFTQANVVQENVIRGGLSAYDRNARRNTTTREVRGIEANVKVNRAVWDVAARLAELRGMGV